MQPEPWENGRFKMKTALPDRPMCPKNDDAPDPVPNAMLDYLEPTTQQLVLQWMQPWHKSAALLKKHWFVRVQKDLAMKGIINASHLKQIRQVEQFGLHRANMRPCILEVEPVAVLT